MAQNQVWIYTQNDEKKENNTLDKFHGDWIFFISLFVVIISFNCYQ